MDITRSLQNDIKKLIHSWAILKEEAKDIGKVYWSTSANAIIGALAGSDAATYSSHLTKNEFVNGISLAEALDKLFSNQAVAQVDYLQYCNLLKYGSAATPTMRSEGVEALGVRLMQIGTDCVEIYKSCRLIDEAYHAQEVGDMIANLDSQRVIPGSEMTKDQLGSAYILIEEFMSMMGNAVVTTGNYANTLGLWQTID